MLSVRESNQGFVQSPQQVQTNREKNPVSIPSVIPDTYASNDHSRNNQKARSKTLQDFSGSQSKEQNLLNPQKARQQSGMSKLSIISEAGEK